VSGIAEASVDVESGFVSVSFSFTDLQVNGQRVNGHAAISTSDLSEYAVKFDVTLDDLGRLTYVGSADVSGDPGSLSTVLDGSGTLSPTSAVQPDELSGWTCSARSSSYEVSKLHRRFDQCYADSGSISVTRTYDCSKLGARGEKASTASTQAVLSWSAATATTGNVDLHVSTSVGGKMIADTSTQTRLPARQCSR
jgi:hypothetical protein